MANRNPLKIAAIVIPHDDHQVVVFVNSEGRVVRIEWSSSSERPVLNSLLEIPVPSSRAPEPKGLETLEWMFLAMCDGRRTLQEICTALNIPVGTGRLIVEKLRSRGYVERIIVRPRV
ncbi:MarR family transcriptional regulator [Infirmifilum sp. NZ]|uniref:MarR family transcriptional regulator n=1 Tax=Infirmifilum sp. NZ TaxID=2926850 RepID=UPI0027AAF7A2|nr:MarR family transcriptional regulator [Infirmifilum sp. NZ]UNQ74142.1 MarR family transcriptional regulator [Infirmifilum sp. NZ]